MILKRIKKVVQLSQHREVILASAILSALVVAFFAIDTFRSYQSDMKSAKTTTQNLAQVLESRLNESFDEIDYRLKDISEHLSQLEVAPVSKREWGQRFVDNYLASSSTLTDGKSVDFFVTDNQGKVLKSIAHTGLDKLIPQDFFQGAPITRVDLATFSIPILNPANSEWVFFMKRSYFKGTEVQGSVISAIRVSYFQGYFESLNIGDSGSITLFSDSRYIMARSPIIEGLFGHKRITEPLFVNGEKVKTFVRVSTLDGQERIITARQIGRFPFGVTVALSHEDVFSAWLHRTMFNAILVLSAFAGFATFMFRYLETQEDLEEQRRKNIAHAKMSSLGEMAGGIAHEINNPLAILQAKIFQMRKLVEQTTVDRAKIFEHADKMDDTVQRIAKIIKGLISFSRNSDADPMAISSVGAVIESTLEFCLARFKANAVEFRMSPIPEVYFKCRESQMAQVILNLLNNGFDAISELPVKWIEVDVKELSQEFEISITDSGQGIPDQVLNKIMFPFFTTKGVGKGTGLGLSISKGIVEEHGGKIRYDSKCKNTRFIVTLPKVASERHLKVAA